MFLDWALHGGGSAAEAGAGLLDSRKVLPSAELQGKFNKPPSGTLPQRERDRQNRRRKWELKFAADDLRKLPLFVPGWAQDHGLDRNKFASAFACHRRARYNSEWKIDYIETYQKAVHHGQFACGSVWQCPVCAAKIAEKRREELIKAVNNAKQSGYHVFFLTFTVRHGMGDDIKSILKNMKKSFNSLTSGRWAEKVNKYIGKVGHVKVLEVTYGKNGWHPHYHVLLFVKCDISVEEIEELFAEKWIDACIKNGLPTPERKYACHAQDGTHAEEYVTKWGIVEEMTRGHIKKDNGKTEAGRTPWQLLEDSSKGDAQASFLFLIYADAFFNARQLVWSKGLKEKLGVEELSDQEIVDAEDEAPAKTLIELDDLQIHALVNLRLLCKVLEFAEELPNDLESYIAIFTDRYYAEHPEQRKKIVKRMMKRNAKDWSAEGG